VCVCVYLCICGTHVALLGAGSALIEEQSFLSRDRCFLH